MGLLSGIGSLFGIGGNQGSYYQAGQLSSPAQDQLNKDLQVGNDLNLNAAISDYSRGNITLNELLTKVNNYPGGQQAAMNAIVNNPASGSKLAQDQVQSDSLLSGLLGKGGSMDQALGEEKNLASRGYSLQPEDYEAYGQASGDIARLFGS